MGAMDGAWIAEGGEWERLETHGEETTSFAVDGERLAVTTASGVYFFRGSS